jgi:hypothetical protein
MAFVGKFWTSLFLIACSLLVATLVSNVASLVFFLLVGVPLAAAGLFFLSVPAQLRVEGDSVGYRRWSRWKVAPLEQFELFRSFLIAFGLAKISGQSRPLIFFLDSENRYLLDRHQRNPSGHTSNGPKDLSPTVEQQNDSIYAAFVASLGFAAQRITKVMSPGFPLSIPDSKSILDRFYQLQFSHPHLVAVLVITALLMFMRVRHMSIGERLIIFFVLGIAAGDLFFGSG